jgi:transposase InsO family protein
MDDARSHADQTELVLAALMMAVQRQHPASEMIHHSDHGSQYAAQLLSGRPGLDYVIAKSADF